MGRTAVNVAGQALVPTIVSERLGMRGPMQFQPAEEGAPAAS
jgi:Na+/H+-dicarboxylate symporter